MWRKLLIVCMLAALSLKWVSPSIATHEIDASITGAGSSAADAVVATTTTAVAAAGDANLASMVSRDARRIALVIGNADYANDPLENPVHDARAVGDALATLGFKVLRHENLNGQQMQAALLEFDRALGAGGVGLFYFSGHGLRTTEKTWLNAIDVQRRSPARLLTQSIDLDAVLTSMSKPRPDKLNLIVLDTCLNNPFQTGDGRTVDVPAQTLIAYATAPGSAATDTIGHGLYTAELLKALAVPGLDISEMFRHVAAAVRHGSNQQQLPWLSSSLSDDFRFVMSNRRTPTLKHGPLTRSPAMRAEVLLAAQGRGILPKDSAEQVELTFWESIKDSTHASDYEAYLQAYPNGRFAALARARIERLRAAAPAAPKAAETPAESARPAPAKPARVKPAPTPTPKAATPAQPRSTAPAAAAPAPAPSTAPQTAPPAAPTSSTSAAKAGSEIKTCPTCPVLIALSPGSFTMGSNSSDLSEKPAHHVTIKAPFAIGKYEVTVAQWNACVDASACPRVSSDAEHAKTNTNAPVRNVSWDDAQQYVKWLSTASGKPHRLPTEAEWEYAARGGTATRYWWGEQMRPGKANCKGCGEPWRTDGPVDVGSFAANPYGLYDVNGSVWEWVSDCWHNSYKNAPADARAWDEPNCRTRVIRGGSWRDGESYMLSTTRFKYDASVRESQNGFRVASDLK